MAEYPQILDRRSTKCSLFHSLFAGIQERELLASVWGRHGVKQKSHRIERRHVLSREDQRRSVRKSLIDTAVIDTRSILRRFSSRTDTPIILVGEHAPETHAGARGGSEEDAFLIEIPEVNVRVCSAGRVHRLR